MRNSSSLFSKGKRIYKRLQRQLTRRYRGNIVAIEPLSGRWVCGKDEVEVAHEAQEQFPGRLFAFFRVGSPALHKLRKKTAS